MEGIDEWDNGTDYRDPHIAGFRHSSDRHIRKEGPSGASDAKAAAGLSGSLVGHIRWQLVAIFALAESDGLVGSNPAAVLVMPRCKPQSPKITLGLDDIRRAEMVLELRERLVFHLAVYHGLRAGEIVGLQPGDIRDGVVYVERRVYKGVVDIPKSKRSERRIPLLRSTLTLFEQWLEVLGPSIDDSWLFPSENPETPIDYSNLKWRNIRPALATWASGT